MESRKPSIDATIKHLSSAIDLFLVPEWQQVVEEIERLRESSDIKILGHWQARCTDLLQQVADLQRELADRQAAELKRNTLNRPPIVEDVTGENIFHSRKQWINYSFDLEAQLAAAKGDTQQWQETRDRERTERARLEKDIRLVCIECKHGISFVETDVSRHIYGGYCYATPLRRELEKLK